MQRIDLMCLCQNNKKIGPSKNTESHEEFTITTVTITSGKRKNTVSALHI